VIFTKNGIRFGFYAATWGVNDSERLRNSKLQVNVLPGIAPLEPEKINLDEIKTVLEEMKNDGAQFRVVSLHWGYEYELYPDPVIMQVARQIVADGADLIMGSHPHVQQPFEVCFLNGYEKTAGLDKKWPAARAETGCVLRTPDGIPRKALVAYSLGNFASNMYTTLCEVGLIQGLKLVRYADMGVDWFLPHSQLVFNRSDKRSLVLLHPDQQLPAGTLTLQRSTPQPGIALPDGDPEREARKLDFLKRHLAIP
jgi:poly-gamma-glutamate synthesis protein (capsule biosynthesis protein)